MTKDEASCTFCSDFLLESELRRQEKITAETDGVTQCIGYIDVDPEIQQKIDAVMDCGGNHTHNAKPDELLEGVTLNQRFDVYHNLSQNFCKDSFFLIITFFVFLQVK